MTPEKYVRSGHRKIEGWLRPEAAWLISRLAEAQETGGAVGEIGVHHGKLFILLCLLRGRGERGVALDLFENQALNTDGSGLGDRDRLLENLALAGIPLFDVVIRAVDSLTLSAEDVLLDSGGSPYRLFSVDGGHTAEITCKDLDTAANVLAPGGLVILDDYFNVEWPGVSEGTNRYLALHDDLEPVGSGHGKTFFTSPGSAQRYRQILRQSAREMGWVATEQVFFGVEHTIVRSRSLPERLRKFSFNRNPAFHRSRP